MLSGVVNDESISHVLRNISQKRQHGVLVLKKGSYEIEVYFFQGRIFDARPKGISHGEVIEQRLKRAQFLDADVELNGDDYTRVHEELVAQLPAFEDKDAYRQLVEHAVLDTLYELQFPNDAVYTLHIQMVSVEREFCPSISVGQLLLDLVTLRDEEGAFKESYPDEAMLNPTGTVASDVTGDTAVVAKYLATPIQVLELYHASCLSIYHFREAVTQLANLGVFTVATEVKQEERAQNGSSTKSDSGFEGALSDDAMRAFFDDDDDLDEEMLGSIDDALDNLDALDKALEAFPDSDIEEEEEVFAEPEDEEFEAAVDEDQEEVEEEDQEMLESATPVSTTNARLLQSNGIVTAINFIFVITMFVVVYLSVGNHLGRW